MPHTPSTPGSSTQQRLRHSYHDHDPDQYHEQFHDLHRDLLLHRDYVQMQHELLQQQHQSQLQSNDLQSFQQQINYSNENISNSNPNVEQQPPVDQSLPPPPPPPVPLHGDRDFFYDLRERSATLPSSLPSEYSNFSNYSNLAALNIAAHPNFFASNGTAGADHRAATLPASLSPRHAFPKEISPRQSLHRPGSAAGLADYPRVRAHMRISDSSLEVGRNAARHQSSPPPALRSPYSCVLLTGGAPQDPFASSLPPAVPLGATAAPYPPGCACNPSSGSLSSLSAACPLHGTKIFSTTRSPHSLPLGPPRSGNIYPDSDADLGSRPRANSGDDAVHHWKKQELNISTEDIKEEGVRQLLLSLQKQVSIMSLNLTSKIDDIQCHQHADTSAALHAIRNQLQDLTASVENCQSEVVEVKRDMVAIKHEIDTLQQAKLEIEELGTVVDRLEETYKRGGHRRGLTWFLCYAIFAAVLGMFQFGFNTGVINAPQGVIQKFIAEVYRERYQEDASEDLNNFMWAVVVAIFAIGGMVGGFAGGYLGNKVGRKRGLLLNNFIGIGGAILMAASRNAMSFEMLILGRLVIGVNCGLNTSLVPMYISEIAPLNLRGGLGTVNQLAVTIGLLLSQVLGIKQLLGTNEFWPLLLGLALIPAVLQLVLLPVCPESPRYLLLTKNKENEARRALLRLRTSSNVAEDIEEMRAEESASQTETQSSVIQLLRTPSMKMPLTIGVVMQLSQQLSGINAVLYYSTRLFIEAGIDEEMSKYATMGVGVVMVFMTLVSIPLMDRAGRRTLHLWGLGGMFVFSIFITISLLIKEMMNWMSVMSVISTLFFVIFFAIGPGSIPWMITAELFTQGTRPAAMSIAVLVNWLSNFIVGIGFPKMREVLDNYTFLPFSFLLACFWIFTYYLVPETKNKTFEEISAIFHRGHADRSTMNCVNTLGGAEHTSLIRQMSGRGHHCDSPPVRSDHSDCGGSIRRGSDRSDSCGGSSRAESGASSSRPSSRASSHGSSGSSRRSVIAQQRHPHPSEPPV